jgi:hypothetical protein
MVDTLGCTSLLYTITIEEIRCNFTSDMIDLIFQSCINEVTKLSGAAEARRYVHSSILPVSYH